MLQKCLPGMAGQIRAYWPHEFLNKLSDRHQIYGVDHVRVVDDTWWAKLLLQGNPRLEAYRQTQGMGADLILHYGEELEELDNVILVNVKSRNVERAGRDPNIISAFRLLDYFSSVAHQANPDDIFDKIRYWVLGFDYKSGVIQNVHVKDLFRLDISRMPPINFDAALQIQWHVKDMVTLPEQTNREFVSRFTKKIQ